MSVDEMHTWHRAADLLYCTKCGAGAGDVDLTCPVTVEKQKARYAREQEAKEKARHTPGSEFSGERIP